MSESAQPHSIPSALAVASSSGSGSGSGSGWIPSVTVASSARYYLSELNSSLVGHSVRVLGRLDSFDSALHLHPLAAHAIADSEYSALGRGVALISSSGYSLRVSTSLVGEFRFPLLSEVEFLGELASDRLGFYLLAKIARNANQLDKPLFDSFIKRQRKFVEKIRQMETEAATAEQQQATSKIGNSEKNQNFNGNQKERNSTSNSASAAVFSGSLVVPADPFPLEFQSKYEI